MLEAFGEAVKVFFEKHLIPTILSLILGTIVLLLTPKDWWMLVELSKVWYWLFVCGCFFLFIQFILWVKDKWKKWRDNVYIKKEENEYQMRENEATIRKLWDYIDELSPEDRKYLAYFLKNNNSAITVRQMYYFRFSSLFASEHVRKQVGSDENGNYVKYVLEENFYALLEFSAKKYGRISRFEEV